MDYEKAYKAVLKTATQWIKDGCTDKEKICLECVFPELRESEDERIRTLIYSSIKYKEPIASESNIEKALAYLEKQKDKRELDFAEGKVEGVKQTCQEIKDAMSLFEPKDLTPFESTFRDYMDSAIRYCLSGEGYQQNIKEWAADLLNLEKQKEQKTIELSDNFEIALEEFLMNADSSSQTFAEDVKKYANKLRGIVCKEQKPAEWSKEDEEHLDSIINSYKELLKDYKACHDVDYIPYNSETVIRNVVDDVIFLKSLRPQSIQNKFDEAMHVADKFEEGYKAGVYDTKAKSWKPSQQQMTNLINVRDHVAQASGHWGESLSSLIDDLEKL